jgi:hypothetical protein
VVDCGSNRRVSKNRIAGVKVSRIALSVVDRGSNRKVSKNHIGGVKVSRIECDTLVFHPRSTTLKVDPRSTTLKAILLTVTPAM